MLEAGASQRKLDGQVFWLTAHLGPWNAFPPSQAVAGPFPGTWPITAAAPRRIHTVFPILPRTVTEPGAPIKHADHRQTMTKQSMKWQAT
jgi:hypothetical protein